MRGRGVSIARWWGAWWLGLLGVAWGTIPCMETEAAGRVWFAGWAAVAGCLSLWTLARRRCSLTGLGTLLLICGLSAMVRDLPQALSPSFLAQWDVVGVLSATWCWLICVTWGTQAVLDHSPPVTRHIPWALCTILSLAWIAWWLQAHGVWSRWVFTVRQDLGGLFSSKTVWAAWAAISLPLLWEQPWRRRWMAVPALAGIIVGQRTSVWLAVGLWLVWRYRSALWPLCRARRILIGWMSLVVFGLAWLRWDGSFHQLWISLLPRLATWPVVLHAIATHPWGIGWSPFAYQLSVVSSAPHPVMGHPSSSVLFWMLSGGWLLGLWVAWGAWWIGTQLRHDGLSGALVVSGVLACIQKTIALAQVGVLAWAVLCWWLIQRRNDDTALA